MVFMAVVVVCGVFGVMVVVGVRAGMLVDEFKWCFNILIKFSICISLY